MHFRTFFMLYISTNRVNFLSFDNDDTKPSKSQVSFISLIFCFKISYCSRKQRTGIIASYILVYERTNVVEQFLNRHGFLSFQIDIFSSEVRGSALKHLSHLNLNSINSLNVFHPSVNKLAGGNSSGKVYLWTE